MLDLDKRSITYLPGVGPKKADILQKEAGISSYEDLLFYFPYKYIDRSRFYKRSTVPACRNLYQGLCSKQPGISPHEQLLRG